MQSAYIIASYANRMSTFVSSVISSSNYSAQWPGIHRQSQWCWGWERFSSTGAWTEGLRAGLRCQGNHLNHWGCVAERDEHQVEWASGPLVRFFLQEKPSFPEGKNTGKKSLQLLKVITERSWFFIRTFKKGKLCIHWILQDFTIHH